MCTSLRSIEFDKEEFGSVGDCLAWLAASPYSYLVDQKGFQLRSNKAGQFISWEKRPVYVYRKNLWQESKLEIVRPSRNVCVVLGVSEGKVFYDDNLPELLKETKDKLEKKRLRQEETKLKQEAEKEARKKKREENKAKKDNKRKSISPEVEFDPSNKKKPQVVPELDIESMAEKAVEYSKTMIDTIP